jgi:hypothetical protein
MKSIKTFFAAKFSCQKITFSLLHVLMIATKSGQAEKFQLKNKQINKYS